MKKTVILLLLSALLLAGCGKAPAPAEEPAHPEAAATADITPAPTAEPTAAPTPAPTAEPTPEPGPVWQKSETEITYSILTLSVPEANTVGADALLHWLVGFGALEVTAYVPEGLTEPLFTSAGGIGAAEIPNAKEETLVIRLLADEAILRTGELEEILPHFSYEYGYSVEICAAEGDTAREIVLSGGADLALMDSAAVRELSRLGLNRVLQPWMKTFYFAE